MRNGRDNFHPRKFVGNNIEYRISSSAALARYKEAQSYILNQLAFNPFHDFSTTAKEILLFKYDIWFDFISELEQYLLINGKNSKVDDVLQLIEIRVKYYEETLRAQTNIINQEYFEIWNEGHKFTHSYLVDYTKEIFETDLKIPNLIGAIADALIKILNHTLYELQELDLIMFTDSTPTFILDDLSCDIGNKINNCIIYNRIIELRKIRPFNKIIIKNYLSNSIPFSLTKLYNKLKESDIEYSVI